MPRLTALVAALALPIAVLNADVVTLDDGRVIEGEIVSEPGAPVVEVRIASSGLVAIQRFEAAHVVKIEHGPSPRQRTLEAIAKDRAALADGGESEQWMALARRAREVGDTGLAKDLAQQAIARDRQNPEAHRLLGESKQNGVWMRPREAAAARGEVFFRGRWVSWVDRDGTLAAEEKARQEAEATRKKLLEQRAAEAALAAANEPPATADLPYASNQSYGYTYGAYTTVPRVVYWAPYPYAAYQTYQSSTCAAPGLVINASGRSGSTSWSLNWHW